MGNLYGTTYQGGAYNFGTVFKVDPSGNLTTLHSFDFYDGRIFDGNPYPYASLILDNAGNLYGTTYFGGAYGNGTVFKLDPSGNLTTLYSFNVSPGNNGPDGANPYGSLTLDDLGNLYGTTWSGGLYGNGTVFKLDSYGNLNTLHSFNGFDGFDPIAALVFDDVGNLYGTTLYGGPGGHGTVFKLDTYGNLTTLHGFHGSDGSHPGAALVLDGLGNLYGTTSGGTGEDPHGTVFKLDSYGNLNTLHSFNGSDGRFPWAALTLDESGNLFGTTEVGGPTGQGTVFKLDSAGNLATLHSFNGSDGRNPYSALTLDDLGNLYGTTAYGGSIGAGTVFKLDSSGNLTSLTDFRSPSGTNPVAALILDGSGNLYGTTFGWSNWYGFEQGTVFKLSPSGNLTTLYKFGSSDGWSDGALPGAALVFDDAGSLYGTTIYGGLNGSGKVFKLDSSSNLTTLYSFDLNGWNGWYEKSALIFDDVGNLYGTTGGGGLYGDGMVYRLDPLGNLATLYSFNGSDGRRPNAALIFDGSGNLYGTTEQGGPNRLGELGGRGIVFKLNSLGNLSTLRDVGTGGALIFDGSGNLYGKDGETVFKIDSSGSLSTLHTFSSSEGAHFEKSGLIFDCAGNLYGTSFGGNGDDPYGSVFKLDPSGNLTTLHRFSNSDGNSPNGLILDGAGNLYGTAQNGGPGGAGLVFRVTLPGGPPMAAVPTLSQSPNPDGSATLTSSAASAYLWSTGATTQSVSVSASGQYWVTVTNGAGCSATSAVTNVAVTPTGSAVSVVVGNVTTTYSTVSSGGTTTVIPIDPAAAGTLPAGGYAVSDLGIAFEISTTATISGDIIIGFVVPGSVDEVTFNSLRVLHGEGGSLVDRTYFSADGCAPAPTSPCPAPNFTTRTIYARVSSLSPFVLATLPNPSVQTVTVPAAPVALSTTVNVQGTFTDSGTHTATWSWDDGTTSAGVVSESAGHGTVTGSHVYTAAGVYLVTLTVTDSGGSSGQKVSPYLVVYDPAGGFVTGGGWVNSPAGAYVANPTLTGQANFGFVSKYKKNVTPPTGEAEFHFSDLNFHSGTYEWLVITGAKAQCQGSGTINNAGNYGFKLTVIDGQVSGGGGTDKIRLKIWDKNNGNAIVYDNQMGAADSANPTAAIGGGSIVIH